MEDFGEYTPLDSVSGDGIDGTRAHNPYATRYHCAAYDAVTAQPRPIIRFQRSGWSGAAPCAQVVWGGDPTTAFGFDGLASAVTQALNLGMSGISVWGSDIGGFFALGFNELSSELLARWVQFGAMSGVMRTQRNGVALPPGRSRPQVDDPDQIGNWRRYTKLHTQLYPYLVAAQSEYRDTGMPLMRHMALAFPGDDALVALDDQFMFGPSLLAAPVPGALDRELGVPPGLWVDLWRSVSYDEASGGLGLGSVATVPGGGSATLPSPLTELPLLARAGSILPLLPPDVDTLADYGPSDLVHLSDRAARLEADRLPPRPECQRFLRGRAFALEERPGGWTLRVEGSRERTYDLQASLATLQSGFDPCQVSLDGAPLAAGGWSYDSAMKLLNASFRTTDGTLRVSDCGAVAADGGPGATTPAATVVHGK